ncbi:MAG: rhamnulose-1-phosphate aldolase [Chloroflexi bacterium]|nr:rhamnulose-1-phosphate aldolase [Chloroflexota bacterium]
MQEAQISALVPELTEFQRIAYWLAHRGWSEANGGNVSVRLERVPDEVRALPAVGPPVPMTLAFPALADTYYLVTGTGKRMRDIMHALEPNVGLIRVQPGGQAYESLWGAAPVTSEFPAHSAIHHMCLAERPAFTAIVHTHPVALVALTHVPALADATVLNDVLWRMQHETRIFLPEGLGLVPYQVPGSVELGLASAEALRTHKIISWDKHGIVAIGRSLSQALDWIEVLEKAAAIYWAVVHSGAQPVGLTDEQMQATLDFWGVSYDNTSPGT